MANKKLSVKELEKLYSFGGWVDESGNARWKNGDAMTNPSKQLSTVSFGNVPQAGPTAAQPMGLNPSNSIVDTFSLTNPVNSNFRADMGAATTEAIGGYGDAYTDPLAGAAAEAYKVTDTPAVTSLTPTGTLFTPGQAAPTNLSINGLTDGFTPEQIGQMDFDKVPAGTYAGVVDAVPGTDPATNWGMDGLGGVGLGAGQLGLGIASFLDGQQTANKQRKLLDQQYASNADEMVRKKKVNEAANAAFGTA